MSRILRSEAVCLRRTPSRETSKIISFFTRDYGKLLLQAKGARRPKSKFGAALEILTHTRIIFYKREARHINTLSDAEILEDFPVLRADDERLRAGVLIAEFTDRVFETEAPNPAVFRLLLEALTALNSTRSVAGKGLTPPRGLRQGSDPYPHSFHPMSVAFSCMFKIAGRLGFAPQLEECISCGRKKAATFSPRLGGLLCSRCATRDPDSIRVSAPVLRALHVLYYRPFHQVARVPDAVHDIVMQYLRYHFERLELKSLR